jgi:hypothetical protein
MLLRLILKSKFPGLLFLYERVPIPPLALASHPSLLPIAKANLYSGEFSLYPASNNTCLKLLFPLIAFKLP